MIFYAMMIRDIDQSLYQKKKKKKKKKKIFRPTYPNFFGHVTGNTHTFLFGLIVFASNQFAIKCQGNNFNYIIIYCKNTFYLRGLYFRVNSRDYIV